MASDLLPLLQVEPLEHDLFRGFSPHDSPPRVFGGQVAAQALVAAARTVDSGTVHSLHSYFMRAGSPAAPILYRVQRIHDGRSFTTRSVQAIQRGEVIFVLAASFHDNVDEEGFDHFEPLDEVPPPAESVPTFPSRLTEWGIDAVPPAQLRLIDFRPIEFVDPADPRPMAPQRRVWFRAHGTLPDDPVLHACVVTYASDLYLLGTALLPHGVPSPSPEVSFASLDHAMWFHRPFRADEWLLYTCYSPTASGSRGLATGRFTTLDGRMVATTVQEGLVRVPRK
jgi:acyl-CoA thioesterase-2